MKMTLAEKVEDVVLDNQTLFGFEYNGIDGNIDPWYTPKDGQCFHLMYNGLEQDVKGFDAVLNTPFVDGHTLQELSDSGAKIIITEQ